MHQIYHVSCCFTTEFKNRMKVRSKNPPVQESKHENAVGNRKQQGFQPHFCFMMSIRKSCFEEFYGGNNWKMKNPTVIE